MPSPERTDDGRHIVVNGRKWRATDPGVPGKLRQELVNALMAARRGVRSSGGSRTRDAGTKDSNATAVARRRVHDAKVALGERGAPWWAPTAEGTRARIDAAACALCRQRAPGTVCPSEVARVVRGDATEAWRELMPLVRERARRLARAGVVDICQGGEPVDPEAELRGPIRLRAAEGIDGLREEDGGESGAGEEDRDGHDDEEEEEVAAEEGGDLSNNDAVEGVKQANVKVRAAQEDKVKGAPARKRHATEQPQPLRRSSRLRKNADRSSLAPR